MADWTPTWRDHLAERLCNWIMRHIASDGYRNRLTSVIVHGLVTAPRKGR